MGGQGGLGPSMSRLRLGKVASSWVCAKPRLLPRPSRLPDHRACLWLLLQEHTNRQAALQIDRRQLPVCVYLFCLFLKRLGLFSSQQELTSRSSHRFSNVPAIPTCHSWAQGRGKKGRRHSGAGGMVAAGERCSWPRPVLSFPQKAVGGWWIVLALLGHSRLG